MRCRNCAQAPTLLVLQPVQVVMQALWAALAAAQLTQDLWASRDLLVTVVTLAARLSGILIQNRIITVVKFVKQLQCMEVVMAIGLFGISQFSIARFASKDASGSSVATARVVVDTHPPPHHHTPHPLLLHTSCCPRGRAAADGGIAAHLPPPRHSRSHDADFCGRRDVIAAAGLYSSHPLRGGRAGVTASSEQIQTSDRGDAAGRIENASVKWR